jgi:hypothetical protein
LQSSRPPTRNRSRRRCALLDVAGWAALAAGTLAFDRWLGPDRTPSRLHVDISVAQSLTTGFSTGLLFVVSVVFMVRMYAA